MECRSGEGKGLSTIAIKWMQEQSRLFACRDSLGNTVMSGSWLTDEDSGQDWRAAKPSDLLLMGLASCAAHDVVAILERQRQNLAGLRVDVDGRQQADPPYAFTDIHLRFTLAGPELTPDKVERAIDLSINKYCSVAATVRGVASITYDFVIES